MGNKFGFFCLFSFLFLSSSYRCSSPPQTSCYFFFIANKIFHFKKTMYNFCRRKLLKVNNFDVNEVFMERHLNFHISISLSILSVCLIKYIIY